MGWKESSVMHERCRFVLEAKSKGANISELCRHYGVSHKTGYKWLRRYEQEGAWLVCTTGRAGRTTALWPPPGRWWWR